MNSIFGEPPRAPSTYFERRAAQEALDDERARLRDEEIRQAAQGHTCNSIRRDSWSIEACGRPATNISFGDIWGSRSRPSWRCRKCWYAEYMRSSQWERTREKALRRASWTCEHCNERAGRSAKGNRTGLQVHHLSYERVARERDEDLIVLCFDCHKKELGLS